MDNNLNNNTDNNVNVENVIPNASDANPVVPTPINAQSIQPTVGFATNIVTGETTSNVESAGLQTVAETPTVGTEVPTASVTQPVGTVATPSINTTQTVTPSATVKPSVSNSGNNDEVAQKAYYKKIYIMMGIIVSSVLLIAGILLYFLLNGTIENRNRLTCTKTIQGDGYQEHIKRYYTFDGGLMKRVYFTHTFTYDNLTDDMYEQKFGNVITNDNHPISSYGLGTNINRDGNVVTVTAFDDNYLGEFDKDILKRNKGEGYSCE